MIHYGDLFDVLPTLPEASVDACVTDPPYGIGFMGREWDTFKPEAGQKRIVPNRQIDSDNPNLKGRTRGPASSPSAVEYDYSLTGLRKFQQWNEQWAREVFRALKPGAHMVVCGAPRSFHRMACGIEDAGFDIRDCFSWLYGQGFPKSLDVSKAIDKAAGAQRDRIRGVRSGVVGDTYAQDAWSKEFKDSVLSGEPITDAAKLWVGWGTALKPGWEPLILARKPFKGSVASNVLTHGTAALNIDVCRIETLDDCARAPSLVRDTAAGFGKGVKMGGRGHALGRWPSNVLLDAFSAAALDEQSGECGGQGKASGPTLTGSSESVARGKFNGVADTPFYGDSGGASRFFYVAKPSREERDYGTDGLVMRQRDDSRKEGNPGGDNPRNRGLQPRGNFHPTVKPVELMRWLVRLVTPINGTVLDPFTGSGTTGMACRYELRNFIGIEREAEYVAIAERRIAQCVPLFGEATA